jgi:hypothetical protein
VDALELALAAQVVQRARPDPGEVHERDVGGAPLRMRLEQRVHAARAGVLGADGGAPELHVGRELGRELLRRGQ